MRSECLGGSPQDRTGQGDRTMMRISLKVCKLFWQQSNTTAKPSSRHLVARSGRSQVDRCTLSRRKWHRQLNRTINRHCSWLPAFGRTQGEVLPFDQTCLAVAVGKIRFDVDFSFNIFSDQPLVGNLLGIQKSRSVKDSLSWIAPTLGGLWIRANSLPDSPRNHEDVWT